MSTGTTPPSRRVAEFLDRRRGQPPGDPSGGRSVGWLLSRLAIAAGLAVIAWFIGWYVLFGLSCACTPEPSRDSPMEGTVVAVDSAGLGQVREFTLRMIDGESFTLVVGTLENPTEFPPGHLAEHLASSEPIRAYFRESNGTRVVYRLEDAMAAPTGTRPPSAGAT